MTEFRLVAWRWRLVRCRNPTFPKKVGFLSASLGIIKDIDISPYAIQTNSASGWKLLPYLQSRQQSAKYLLRVRKLYSLPAVDEKTSGDEGGRYSGLLFDAKSLSFFGISAG
jgi:hypothetical protein